MEAVAVVRAVEIGGGSAQGETSVNSAQLPQSEQIAEDVVGAMGPAGEAAAVRIPRTPLTPTLEMVESHRLTGHAVYRSWCPHCVRGRGHNSHHIAGSSRNGPNEFSKLSFDYGFLGTKNLEEDTKAAEEGQSPVLVMHDSKTSGVYAHLVPRGCALGRQ